MVTSNKFENSVRLFFSYLEDEFGMKVDNVIIMGNFFYAIRFSNEFFLISISYENIEDHFNIQLIRKIDGEIADYDDLENSINLNRLYALLIHKIDRNELAENKKLLDLHTSNNFEKTMLDNARKLRICLKNS